MTTVRVVLPGHLRTLAKISGEVTVDADEPVTLASVLDAVESSYPMLRGTIRAHGGGPRRDFVRFFACSADLSHEPIDAPLPAAVVDGSEPLLVVGAMAGG